MSWQEITVQNHQHNINYVMKKINNIMTETWQNKKQNSVSHENSWAMKMEIYATELKSYVIQALKETAFHHCISFYWNSARPHSQCYYIMSGSGVLWHNQLLSVVTSADNPCWSPKHFLNVWTCYHMLGVLGRSTM